MATTKSKLTDLKFEPAIDEQLLLPRVQSRNIMLSYKDENRLHRVLALIILLVISQESSNNSIPRILYLTKRNSQENTKKNLNELLNQTITIHNGGILPIARKQDYNRFSIIISTPKTVKNDLKDEFFSFNHFSLILIDYAEMGASSSLLRYLTDQLTETQVIGISKEQNLKKIQQACVNLKLKEIIKIQNETPGVNRSNIQHISFPLPKEYWLVLDLLDRIKRNELGHLEQLGFALSPKSNIREISAIHSSILSEKNSKLLIKTANLQRIMNLQKIVVSEGFTSVIKYFADLDQRLKENENFIGRKSIVYFLRHPVLKKLQEYISLVGELEHPKLRLVTKIVNKYNTGISIVTNNHSNADFLGKYFQKQEISVLHIAQPITSFSTLQLEKKLFSYTGNKTQVCITNTANQLIADNSNIIIAYDVSADIVKSLENIETSILRVFLIAKQTADDDRFNYLKNLGSKAGVDFRNVNEFLQSKEVGIEIEKDDSTRVKPKFKIKLSPDLYESTMPYLFPEKDFVREFSVDFLLPGFKINESQFFAIISPETIENYNFQNLSTDLDKICKVFSSIQVMIFPQILETFKIEYRSEILEMFRKNDILVIYVKSNEEIFSYTKSILEKIRISV